MHSTLFCFVVSFLFVFFRHNSSEMIRHFNIGAIGMHQRKSACLELQNLQPFHIRRVTIVQTVADRIQV